MFGKGKKKDGEKGQQRQEEFVQRQGNVEVVKSLLDVRMPTLADISSRSPRTVGRRRRPSLDGLPDLSKRRFSRSETALVGMAELSRSETEKPTSSHSSQLTISHLTPSRSNTTAATSRGGPKRSPLPRIKSGEMHQAEIPFKSPISPLAEDSSNFGKERPPSSLISPMSLELPQLGPPFGEGTLFDPLETINELKAASNDTHATDGDDPASSCYSRTPSASSAGSGQSESVSQNTPRDNAKDKTQITSQSDSQPIPRQTPSPVGSQTSPETDSQTAQPAPSPLRTSTTTKQAPAAPKPSANQAPPMRSNTTTSKTTPKSRTKNTHYSVANPVAAGVFDDEADKDKRPPSSNSTRSPIDQKLMNKPLPRPPQLVEESPRRSASAPHKHRRPQKNGAATVKPPVPLRSAARDLEPVNEERDSITSHPGPGPDLIKAANELVQELSKIGPPPAPSTNGESPLIPHEPPRIVGEAIAPLAVSTTRPKRSQSQVSSHPQQSMRFRSSTTTTKQPPFHEHPALRHVRTESGSSNASESSVDGLAILNPTPPTPASPEMWAASPTKPLSSPNRCKTTSKRKLRFGIPGRSKKNGGNDVVKAQHSRSKTESDLAKASKSFDRQFEAQMARALSPEEDEKEEDEQDQEWSTLLPLKAVKQLGIPLLTSSHIPRLAAAATDQNGALRAPLARMTIPSTIIRSPPMGSEADRFSSSRSSRVRETLFLDSPLDDEEGGKIVIGISKLDYLFPDTAPQQSHRMRAPEQKSRPPLTELHLMIPEICELDAGAPSPRPRQSLVPISEVKMPMPAKTPDDALLALMESIPTLDDLFNVALVNKQFYRVFKKYELRLMKAAMFKMSPPAWELREMSPPWGSEWQGLKDLDAPVPEYTPTLYLRHHARDIFTLVKLKSLILARCGSFLRQDTVRGLSGHDEARAAEVDEAFWRIWTFCRIFGSGKNREMDVKGQSDWLNGGKLAKQQGNGQSTMMLVEPFYSMNNVLFDPPAGFGQGNGNGLTPAQLYDMMEIWNCLGVLLQVVLAQCNEARRFGVYDGLNIKEGDTLKEEALLEEWTFYVMTLGPSAVVALSSVCPVESAEATFSKAKQMGLTKWEAPGDGASRSSFLRDAVSRTYESRMARPSPSPSTSPNANRLSDGSSGPNSSDLDSQTTLASTPLQQRISPTHSFLDVEEHNTRRPPEVSRLDIDPDIQVIDPVDKAIHRMVHDLGFSEHDAKWALKMTDAGDAIDADAAVALLQAERKKREKTGHLFSRLTRSGTRTSTASVETLVNPHSSSPILMNGGPGWRWA